jgi:hypothetical protein
MQLRRYILTSGARLHTSLLFLISFKFLLDPYAVTGLFECYIGIGLYSELCANCLNLMEEFTCRASSCSKIYNRLDG